jgi:hypothetical protein
VNPPGNRQLQQRLRPDGQSTIIAADAGQQ